MINSVFERLYYTMGSCWNIVKYGQDNILEREIQRLYNESTYYRELLRETKNAKPNNCRNCLICSLKGELSRAKRSS